MSKTLMIFSGKGGTGKSFVASNIACGLSSFGFKTLLIDFSFGIRNDDRILGLTDSILYNISDIFDGECKVHEAIISACDKTIPDFIASSPGKQNSDLKKNFKNLIVALHNEYDYIIIDCTASFGEAFEACCFVSDIGIAITTDNVFSVGNCALLFFSDSLKKLKQKYLIINNIVLTSDNDDVSAEEIIDETGANLIGIIPHDDSVSMALENSVMSVQSQTPAGKELFNICKRISGDEVPYEIIKKRKFFS